MEETVVVETVEAPEVTSEVTASEPASEVGEVSSSEVVG